MKKDQTVALKINDQIYLTDREAGKAADNKNYDQIICENSVVTGSHFKKRTCTTLSKRHQNRLEDMKTIRNAQNANLRVVKPDSSER